MRMDNYFTLHLLPPHIATKKVDFSDYTLWYQFMNELINIQNSTQPDVSKCIEISTQLHEWIVSKKENNIELFEFLQLNNSIAVMGTAMAQKRIPLLWDWVLYSVFDTIPETIGTLDIYQSVIRCSRSRSLFVQQNFAHTIIEWSAPVFYLINRTGCFKETGISLLSDVADLAYRKLPDNEAASTLILTLDFAARNDLLQSVPFYDGLYQRYKKEEFEVNLQVQFGIMFSTLVGLKGQYDIANEAEFVLAKYSEELRMHQKLHMLLSTCNGLVDCAINKKEEIFNAIDEYRIQLAKITGDSLLALYDYGPVFEILYPIIVSSFENNQVKFLIELLQRWKGLNHDENINPLLCMPGGPNGLYYATKNGNMVREVETNFSFRDLVSTTNKALQLTLTLNNDSEFDPQPVNRYGIPDEHLAESYYDYLKNYFITNEETKNFLLTNEFTSIAILPYLQTPIQSILLKECGYTKPYSVSFKRPKPDSKIRNVLLFCPDYGVSSQLEKLLLIEILEKSDCTFIVLTDSTEDINVFTSEYTENNSFDLIWITCHGNYDYYHPHKGKLLFQNKKFETSEYDLSQIANRFPSRDKRRLLVSNICDGGVGATLGGLADLGMGPLMVNDSQALISHLWPVRAETAIAFGGLLLEALLVEGSYFEAYQKTLSTLLQDSGSISNEIKAICKIEDCLNFIKPDTYNWESIYNWGGAVFLE